MAGQVYAAPAGTGTSQDTAVTGRRVVATIVDGVLIAAASMAIGVVFGATSTDGGSVQISLEGLAAIIPLVLVFAYYIFLEGTTGQTVGKMLLGIKVVREGTNEAPGLGAATIRTLLRLVDGLFGYLVGFVVVVLASGKNQRLGDMAAKTLVVRK